MSIIRVEGMNGPMVVGDLHFSDRFKGRHKDYLGNCFKKFDDITRMLAEERPSALILAGDIVGLRETNIGSREVFSLFVRYFQAWGKICPIFSVRGNHDLMGYPDYQFLVDLGYIYTGEGLSGSCFDWYRDGVLCARYHLVGYGLESAELQLADGAKNVVIGHNNYVVSGLMPWLNTHIDGIELSTLRNFAGVDMVLVGHIHEPSPHVVKTRMPGGMDCGLLYLGCPTRPHRNRGYSYDMCWVVYFDVDSMGEVSYRMEPWDLGSWDELFDDTDEITEETVLSEEDMERRAKLNQVVGEMRRFSIATHNPMSMLESIPHASEEARACARVYLEKAYKDGGKK